MNDVRLKEENRRVKQPAESSFSNCEINNMKAAAWEKCRMASELNTCNKELRSAAESYMKRKKEVETMKNDLSRLKRFNMQSSLDRNKQAMKGAQIFLATSSKRLVTAYNLLQDTVDASDILAYRREYREAKKSLNEFAALKSSLTQKLETPQTAVENHRQEDERKMDQGQPHEEKAVQSKVGKVKIENLGAGIDVYVGTALDQVEEESVEIESNV